MTARLIAYSAICFLFLSAAGCGGHRPKAARGPSAQELDAVRARAADAMTDVKTEEKTGAAKAE